MPYLTSIPTRHRAIAAMFVITVLWGFTYPMEQDGTVAFPESCYLVLRFGIASAVLLVFSWRSLFSRGLWSRGNARWLLLACAAGFVNYGGFAGQIIGLQTTTSGKMAFIGGLSVVAVPLFMLTVKTVSSRRPWAATILSVFGLICLVGQDLAFNFVVSDAWALFAAFSFALQTILIGMLPKDTDAAMLTTLQVLVCFVCSLSWALFEQPYMPELSTVTLASSAYLGIVTTALALTVQTWGQRHVSTNEAVLIFCTEPAWGAVAGVLIASERLTWLGVLGCALMMAGMLWPQLQTLLSARRDDAGRYSIEALQQLAWARLRQVRHTPLRRMESDA